MSGESAERPDRRWSAFRRALLAFATLLGFGCCFSAGVFFGGMRSEEREYHERYLRERELVEPILASDPAFAELTIARRSSGGIELIGTVPTRNDHSRLFDALARVLGEPRAKELAHPVMLRS